MSTPTKSRICGHCGEAFSYKVSRGSDRRYCTTDCRRDRAKATAEALRTSRASCQADDCDKPSRTSRSPWCEMHYYRLRRNGSLDPVVVAPSGNCAHCGKQTPRRQRTYCSTLCQSRNRIGAEFDGRRCLVCDGSIAHEDNYLRRYCGTPCQRLASRIRRYGLELSDYRDLVRQQAGRCAICQSDSERLVIDHCHNTNTVRGLLCGGCNAGIGMLQEDPDILAAAIQYLR